MDTRRHRSSPFDGEPATRTMLGDTQLSALYEWLGKVRRLISHTPPMRAINDIASPGQPNGDVQIHRHFGSLHLAVDPRRPDGLLGRLRL